MSDVTFTTIHVPTAADHRAFAAMPPPPKGSVSDQIINGRRNPDPDGFDGLVPRPKKEGVEH